MDTITLLSTLRTPYFGKMIKLGGCGCINSINEEKQENKTKIN